MRISALLVIILFLPGIIEAQSLTDFYKKERIGTRIGVSYLNISGYDFNGNESERVLRPLFLWDIRYQRATKKGIYFYYKNLMSSDLLSDLIIHRDLDDQGGVGYRNITSGFGGRISIGRNISYNSEKGTAVSIGAVIGDSYLAFDFNPVYQYAEGFHISPGVFINYDCLLTPKYKLKFYGELSKSITNHQNWAWVNVREKFPYFFTTNIELNAASGFYAGLDFNTIFVKRYEDPFFAQTNTPHPVRLTLGAGYRFNF